MGLLEMLAGARYSDDPEQNQAINMGLLSAGIAALQSKGGRSGWPEALANFAGGGLQGYGAAQQGFQAKKAADVDRRLKESHIGLYGAQTKETEAQALQREQDAKIKRDMEAFRAQFIAQQEGAPGSMGEPGASPGPYAAQMADNMRQAQAESARPVPIGYENDVRTQGLTPPAPMQESSMAGQPALPAQAPTPNMAGKTGNPALDELLANKKRSILNRARVAKPEDLGKVIAELDEPITFKPGEGVLTPGGRSFTMPQAVPGILHDFVSGRAEGIPGFPQANAAIKGPETTAIEAAKAAMEIATRRQVEQERGIGQALGGVATPITIPQGSGPARVTTQAQLANETLGAQDARAQFAREVPPEVQARMLADDRAGRPTEYRVPPQGAQGPQGAQVRPGDIGSVSPPQQVAGEVDLTKQLVQDYTATQHSGNRAQDALARIQVLANALDKIETGKWTDVKRDVVATLDGMGIKFPGGSEFVGWAQFAEVLSRQIALEANKASEDGGKALPGAMAIWETKMIMDLVPTITKVKNGNRMLLDMMTEIEQRKHGVAAVARAYQEQYGINAGMAVAIEQYKRAHPFKFTQPGWVK